MGALESEPYRLAGFRYWLCSFILFHFLMFSANWHGLGIWPVNLNPFILLRFFNVSCHLAWFRFLACKPKSVDVALFFQCLLPPVMVWVSGL